MEIVFAQQGYFVVMINPTGSTTFGQGTPYSCRLTMTVWLINLQNSLTPLPRIGVGNRSST